MHRFLVLSVALAACTPEGESLEPWHGHDDGTPYLGDDLHDRVELSTRIYGEPGEARLTHGGPPLEPVGEVATWHGELAVVEAADDLRVAWEGDGVQLLLWLPRADLVDAVAYPTVGVGRPDAVPDTAGIGQVQVPAGIDVDLSLSEGDHVFVEYEAWSRRSTARVSAWVHLGDVDQAWIRGTPRWFYSGTDAWIAGPILDRPRGDVLAVSADEEPLVVDRTGESEDGWWPVRWSNGQTVVEGWVYEDDLTPIGGTSGGGSSRHGSYCGGTGWFHSDHDMVPANTPLRTDRSGPIVARTTRRIVVPGFDDGGGWHPVETPWGLAELWADPLDLPEPQAAEAEAR